VSSTDQETQAQAPEISPQIVRDIAQSRAIGDDFRERFPDAQPEISSFIEEQLEDSSPTGIAFVQGVAAALWAMYELHLDDDVPFITEESLGKFYPVAQQLLDGLLARHHDMGDEGEEFDAEWLAELPRGAQPHVMGFLLGALRAARFNLSGDEIYRAAALLFSVAGSLEGAATAMREASAP
jgi:hypothetical protein